MIQLKNPLLIDGKIRLVDVFDNQLIIRKYEQLNIEVSRLFANVKQVELYECVKTGYRFYYPFETIGDAEFYEDLSRKRPSYYSERWEHGKALSFIEEGEKVLEVGTGFGNFQKLLKGMGADAHGLELNPHAVDKCHKQGLNVKEGLIEQEAKIKPEQYDVVCSFQVLEHITDVFSFLKACEVLLKPNGRLLIGVPNNNPYLHVNDKYHAMNLPPHHAGLWNSKSLRSLEKIHKLKVEKLEFEPLEKSYGYFLEFQMRNNSNSILRNVLKVTHKYFPGILKKVLCKAIHGRNVLAVYKKIV